MQMQFTLAHGALPKVLLDPCDFSPRCEQPFGCERPFCSWKEFHVLFHGVQMLERKREKHHARSIDSTLNGLRTG